MKYRVKTMCCEQEEVSGSIEKFLNTEIIKSVVSIATTTLGVNKPLVGFPEAIGKAKERIFVTITYIEGTVVSMVEEEYE